MKTYFKYIVPALMAGTLCCTSCTKLDLDPPGRLSTNIFWKDEADANLALTGLYGTLYASGDVYHNGPFWWDNFSDNSYSQHNLGGGQDALISGLSPNSGNFATSLYSNCYISIAATNNFLANIGKAISGEKLKNYRGEAFFLRGFNYFWLAQTYGNVPLVTEDPLSISFNSKRAKSPRAEILKQIEQDLDSAIAYLPNLKFNNGHAVKATAMGYKVRMLLFEKRYAEAASLANTIITDGLFSLNNNYPGNFYKPDQRSSPEIMFSIQFQAPAVKHPRALDVFLIGPGWKDVQGTQDLINEYEPGDPRKTMTFFFPGDTRAEGWPYSTTVATPGVNEWVNGFYPAKKWVDPRTLDPSESVIGDQDYVLLRYADIKLMYAEAQNEAIGPDASVYTQVNEVRARPGINMPALPVNLDQVAMRARIRHERRVELALEGTRYFDLRRWGIAGQKLSGFVQNPLTPNVKTIYRDAFEFWPIPQTEIDRNTPVLEQNIGY